MATSGVALSDSLKKRVMEAILQEELNKQDIAQEFNINRATITQICKECRDADD